MFWNAVGGAVAYGGALRLFPFGAGSALAPLEAWNGRECWKRSYGRLAPEWVCFGEDAFGAQYLMSSGAKPEVGLFWSETGDVEWLGVDVEKFLRMIMDDPDGTVSLSLFDASTKVHGRPRLDEHFAARIEIALGGTLEPENVVRMDAVKHMNALGAIALQIHDMPVGTRIDAVV